MEDIEARVKCSNCNNDFENGDMVLVSSPQHGGEVLLHTYWFVSGPNAAYCDGRYSGIKNTPLQGQRGMYWDKMILKQPPATFLKAEMVRLSVPNGNGIRVEFNEESLNLLARYLKLEMIKIIKR